MITIDRKRVEETFKNYTDLYDTTDEKVKLKVDHTYRVAELCEQIAKSENMPLKDIELAWLVGMLHDIGRFEQLRQYGTFIDAESVDHAKLGVSILFEEGKLRDFIDDDREDALIKTAVAEHSVYRIPKDLDERTAKICHILRDADKIDILKVNVEVPLEEIYNVTTEELRSGEVSDAVMENFYEHKAILRNIKKDIADHVVGHISLVFELEFPESLKIVAKQGYLDKLLNFESDNPKTRQRFRELKAEMEKYLDKQPI